MSEAEGQIWLFRFPLQPAGCLALCFIVVVVASTSPKKELLHRFIYVEHGCEAHFSTYVGQMQINLTLNEPDWW